MYIHILLMTIIITVTFRSSCSTSCYFNDHYLYSHISFLNQWPTVSYFNTEYSQPYSVELQPPLFLLSENVPACTEIRQRFKVSLFGNDSMYTI